MDHFIEPNLISIDSWDARIDFISNNSTYFSMNLSRQK